MIPAIMLTISTGAAVLQNGLFNKVCKKNLKSDGDLHLFNVIGYMVCTILFGALNLFSGSYSLYTVLVGLVFGLVTALSTYFKMTALNKGPMHITVLIGTASTIVSSLSGVVMGIEKFSIYKLAIVGVLLFFIYLTLDNKAPVKPKKGWGISVFLTFILTGLVGVIQKIHQSSAHKDEAPLLLFSAFVLSLAYSGLFAYRNRKGLTAQTLSVNLFSVVCGVCTVLMHFINLKLVGMLPSQLFFPLVNGSAMIISTVMSVVLFREYLSKRQIAGIAGGIASLIVICFVP
jgi:drug/metabolite transporter (DMT)-like permease